jgi:hypothetical protein
VEVGCPRRWVGCVAEVLEEEEEEEEVLLTVYNK